MNNVAVEQDGPDMFEECYNLKFICALELLNGKDKLLLLVLIDIALAR